MLQRAFGRASSPVFVPELKLMRIGRHSIWAVRRLLFMLGLATFSVGVAGCSSNDGEVAPDGGLASAGSGNLQSGASESRLSTQPNAAGLPPAGGTSAPDSLPLGTLPVVKLTSATGGSSVPFTVGQVFRQGDVPSGRTVQANLPSFQAIVRNRWPDGSAKVAVLSGRAALPANSAAELRLSTSASGASPASGEIQLGALIALNPQASIALAPFGPVSLSTVIASPWKQTIAGPEMSEWIYRQPVGTDPHLVVWWRVRYYGGNDADILVGVENGYLLVPNPAQKNYTATITINGSQRFSGALQHFHHTRWALQFWYGADPQLTPAHDGRYLTDSKLFPNYGWRNPSDRALNAISNDRTPFTQSDFPNRMGAGGYHATIGLLPIWDALYLTSTDPRAWRSMIAHAYGYGRYGVHYRDEATQRPALVSRYPNLVIDGSTSISVHGASTTGQYTPGSPQSGIPAFAASHHPAPPYAAALLTGEWWLIEELQFVASTNVLHITDHNRQFGVGLIRTEDATTDRGAAWRLRTLAMTITASPDDDTQRAEYKSQWAASMKWYADRYVRGSTDSGAYVNNLGMFKGYSATGTSPYNPGNGKWWGAAWMQAFLQACLGYAWDMQPGAEDDLRLVRDHAYKFTVGLMGDASGWDYRRGAPYDFPFSQVDSVDPPTFFPSFKATLDYYEQFKALTPVSSQRDTVLRNPSSDTAALSDDFATGYWGNTQPARAYAVDHRAAGAAEGYARFSGASNYASALVDFHDIPIWGIAPR